mgnify:CR=1 FL=1
MGCIKTQCFACLLQQWYQYFVAMLQYQRTTVLERKLLWAIILQRKSWLGTWDSNTIMHKWLLIHCNHLSKIWVQISFYFTLYITEVIILNVYTLFDIQKTIKKAKRKLLIMSWHLKLENWFRTLLQSSPVPSHKLRHRHTLGKNCTEEWHCD